VLGDDGLLGDDGVLGVVGVPGLYGSRGGAVVWRLPTLTHPPSLVFTPALKVSVAPPSLALSIA
jgi:hypothetical protein